MPCHAMPNAIRDSSLATRISAENYTSVIQALATHTFVQKTAAAAKGNG